MAGEEDVALTSVAAISLLLTLLQEFLMQQQQL